MLGLFPLLLGGALAFGFGALSFELCRALAVEFCGALSLALGGQLALALGGQFSLPLGAFLFPSGGTIPSRGMPITFRAAVAPQGVIRPCSAVLWCAAVRQRVAIWLDADGVGMGDRDRTVRGQAWQWRRIVICLRPALGR